MNPKEILKVISKQWCSLEDLKKLTGLGKNNLLKYIINESLKTCSKKMQQHILKFNSYSYSYNNFLNSYYYLL